MVPFRGCIGANVNVDGERHIHVFCAVAACWCKPLQLLYVLRAACCGHPLQSLVVFPARASREEKEVEDGGEPSHAWRG